MARDVDGQRRREGGHTAFDHGPCSGIEGGFETEVRVRTQGDPTQGGRRPEFVRKVLLFQAHSCTNSCTKSHTASTDFRSQNALNNQFLTICARILAHRIGCP